MFLSQVWFCVCCFCFVVFVDAIIFCPSFTESATQSEHDDDEDVSSSSQLTTNKSFDVDIIKLIGDSTLQHVVQDLKQTNIEFENINITCFDEDTTINSQEIPENADLHLQQARFLSPKFFRNSRQMQRVRSFSPNLVSF